MANLSTLSARAAESGGVQPADVAKYYDTWTKEYVEAFGDCIQAHRPSRDEDLLDYIMARAGLRNGMRVLDAGCGICGPARYFVGKKDLAIEALTISSVQAGIARVKNKASNLDRRINVTVGDFHRLREIYGREQFDIVYFLESLSHSSRPADVIRSAYEVLRPGGMIYIKDFFIRPCEREEEQDRVLNVVARVDAIFVVKTAWAAQIQEELRRAELLPIFVANPQFDVDNSRWQQFESKHRFDLFAGEDSFDWSEWLEMKYQKP